MSVVEDSKPSSLKLRKALEAAMSPDLPESAVTEYRTALARCALVASIHRRHLVRAYAAMKCALKSRPTPTGPDDCEEAAFIYMKLRQTRKALEALNAPSEERRLQEPLCLHSNPSQRIWTREDRWVDYTNPESLVHALLLDPHLSIKQVHLDTSSAFAGIDCQGSVLEREALRMAMWGAMQEEVQQHNLPDQAHALLMLLMPEQAAPLLHLDTADGLCAALQQLLQLRVKTDLCALMRELLCQHEARLTLSAQTLLDTIRPRAQAEGTFYETMLFQTRLQTMAVGLQGTARWLKRVLPLLSRELLHGLCSSNVLACQKAHAIALVATVMYPDLRKKGPIETLQHDKTLMEQLCVRVHARLWAHSMCALPAIHPKTLLEELVRGVIAHTPPTEDDHLVADLRILVQVNALVHWPIYALFFPNLAVELCK